MIITDHINYFPEHPVRGKNIPYGPRFPDMKMCIRDSFCSKCFSPFLHSTGALSVSREYLALPDGPGRFRQNSSCSALVRIPLGFAWLRIRGCHALWLYFPEHSAHQLSCHGVVLQMCIRDSPSPMPYHMPQWPGHISSEHSTEHRDNGNPSMKYVYKRQVFIPHPMFSFLQWAQMIQNLMELQKHYQQERWTMLM